MFEDNSDDLLVFKEEEPEEENTLDILDATPWKVLIVDDEDVVHNTTKLVLHDFKFEGKSIEFISAYSSIEAKK